MFENNPKSVVKFSTEISMFTNIKVNSEKLKENHWKINN